MNALDVVAACHGILGALVGATGVSFHAIGTWTIVLVSAATNAAAHTLSASLELGTPKVQSHDGQWWLRAAADFNRGAVRVEVIGPHHAGPPPGRLTEEPGT